MFGEMVRVRAGKGIYDWKVIGTYKKSMKLQTIRPHTEFNYVYMCYYCLISTACNNIL